MATTLDLSIIVIAFNEEQRISRCLEALLTQQTRWSYEVIVVDDGSTDGTSDVVRSFMASDGRIRLIRHEKNLGRGAARRTGQDATTSPRVAFVDADVVVPPQWVDVCARELPGRSAVSGLAVPDGDCVVIWRICRPTVRPRGPTAGIGGGNVMFDAAALEIEGFEPISRLGEDFRLAHRMAARGMRLATLPELVSQHDEARTYRSALRWLYDTGVDAASLPFEFRVLRVPDLAWLCWLLSLLSSVVLGAAGVVSPIVAVLIVVAVTLLIDAAFVASRFRLRPHPIRWAAAVVLNAPLMCAYLIGRTFGLVTLAARLARR